MQFTIDSHHNFNKKELRGCNFEVLPFIRLFPPKKMKGYGRGWTIHFGWAFWTVIIHQFDRR